MFFGVSSPDETPHTGFPISPGGLVASAVLAPVHFRLRPSAARGRGCVAVKRLPTSIAERPLLGRVIRSCLLQSVLGGNPGRKPQLPALERKTPECFCPTSHTRATERR